MAKFNQILSLTSTTEIYSYLLWFLTKLTRKQNPENEATTLLIETIKNNLLNHKPLDKENFLQALEGLKDNISEEQYIPLYYSIKFANIEGQSLKKRWENPFNRYLESLFAIAYTTNPPKKMIEAVALISQKLSLILEKNSNHPKVQLFLAKISQTSSEQEAFGKFEKNLDDLTDLLTELKNVNSSNFIRVLLIHYSFARYLIRENIDFATPLPNYLLKGGFYDYLNQVNSKSNQATLSRLPQQLRKDFIDGKLRGASCFSDWKLTRGRGDFTLNLSTNTLGTCLLRQDRELLPQLPQTISWQPDAICQAPYYPSNHIQTILNKDLTYVSGPSGMTTLMLGVLELLLALPTQELKDNYVLAIASYLVSGGLHSLHEVLLVAHDLLGYFPNYQLGEYESLINHFNQDKEHQKKIISLWDNYFDYCERYFTKKLLNTEFNLNYKAYFESKLALAVLNTVPPAVTRISQQIIKIVNKKYYKFSSLLQSNQRFAEELFGEHYFGRLPNSGKDALTAALDALADDQTPLIQIIHIHAIFSRYLPSLIKQASSLKNQQAFSIVKHSLFASDLTRGRCTVNSAPSPTINMGISQHPVYLKRLNKTTVPPHLRGLDEFAPEVKSDTYSKFIHGLMPFASGLSGHALRLFEAANYYCNLSAEEWQEYGLAVFAYLAAGGNHSFYEVMVNLAALKDKKSPTQYNDCIPKSFRSDKNYEELEQEFSQLCSTI
ncbi:serine/threonine-protein kinase [Legionella beliardensis]|uniref:Serine/threonine-protein kinase n=1 Tax=Legionella beliardensis TaxID=91822 RepID=A0A378I379_9GAMM|nr:hypothetical protein [Legionella beliardensis]STX29210.1 serine/threonine-protein kinase [Legionella beliardensis]